jgi:DNA-binding NtrC family response regulator
MDGAERGKEVVPDRAVVRVGSATDVDVVLTDPTVSRYHCELSLKGDRVRVVDTGSANGTFAGGLRFRDAEVPMGTPLTLGRTTVRVTTADEMVEVPLSTKDRFGTLLGRSARMREVFAVLERVSPSNATVLLEGESGTGKELAAEGIHGASPRAKGPLVVFDCGAVPHDLVESALFGHVRGAFTGAVADRRGVFEEADGGTLFFDEIGELPIDLQPKLLRAIEKREVRPVGSSQTIACDVRVVAATNRALEAEVNAGRFREDLYYRLSVVRVTMPPLRERLEDVPMLVAHFLSQLSADAAEPPRLSDPALAALAARPWPGNVRELKNAVERTVALMGGATSAPGASSVRAAPPDLSVPFHEACDAFARRYLEAAMRRSGGNVSAAAKAAGVSRKLIQRMMRRYGLR